MSKHEYIFGFEGDKPFFMSGANLLIKFGYVNYFEEWKSTSRKEKNKMERQVIEWLDPEVQCIDIKKRRSYGR